MNWLNLNKWQWLAAVYCRASGNTNLASGVFCKVFDQLNFQIGLYSDRRNYVIFLIIWFEFLIFRSLFPRFNRVRKWIRARDFQYKELNSVLNMSITSLDRLWNLRPLYVLTSYENSQFLILTKYIFLYINIIVMLTIKKYKLRYVLIVILQ